MTGISTNPEIERGCSFVTNQVSALRLPLGMDRGAMQIWIGRGRPSISLGYHCSDQLLLLVVAISCCGHSTVSVDGVCR